MPYKCRLVDPPSETRTVGEMRPGDMYFAPWQIADPVYGESLSRRYFQDHAAERAPVVVILPDGTPFCVDQRAFNHGVYSGDGWVVTGTPPELTLSPSINVTGSYHGYLIDGELTDDIEGRGESHRQMWARRDYYAGEK